MDVVSFPSCSSATSTETAISTRCLIRAGGPRKGITVAGSAFPGDGNGNFTLTSNDQRFKHTKSGGCRREWRWAIGPGLVLPWPLATTRTRSWASSGFITDRVTALCKAGLASSNMAWTQVAVADFNGDGVPDVAVFETDCDAVSSGCTLTSAATLHIVSGLGGGAFADDTIVLQPAKKFGFAVVLCGIRDTKPDLDLQQLAIEQHHLLHPALLQYNHGKLSNPRRAEHRSWHRSAQSQQQTAP